MITVLTTPGHFGILFQDQNKHQLLHRIARVRTSLIYNNDNFHRKIGSKIQRDF